MTNLRPARRRAAALTALAVLMSACGGGSGEKAPPGSPSNPLVGKATSDAESARPARGPAPSTPSPGYAGLVTQQAAKPQSRFTPCNLVTKRQAESIMGAPILQPVEAPQGPTCIYRSASGDSFVTLAVQRVDIRALRPRIRQRRRVEVHRRTAYCGTDGRPILYVAMSGGRTLTVSAPCELARRFARTAAPRLES